MSLPRLSLGVAPLVEPPHVSHPAAQGTGFILAHALRDGVHPPQVILQVVTSAELLPVAAAMTIEALPIAAGNLVDGLLMTFTVVWSRKSFGP